MNSSVNFVPKYIGGSELPKDLDAKIKKVKANSKRRKRIQVQDPESSYIISSRTGPMSTEYIDSICVDDFMDSPNYKKMKPVLPESNIGR